MVAFFEILSDYHDSTFGTFFFESSLEWTVLIWSNILGIFVIIQNPVTFLLFYECSRKALALGV